MEDHRLRPGRRHTYAIVRLDDLPPDANDRVTVVKVLDTTDRETAEREASRLNEVSASPNSRYFAQVTRLVEPHDDVA